MAFTQVTITQNFDSADGTEPSGTVTFTPTSPMFDGTTIIPAVPVSGRLDGTGTLSIPLAANTDATTSPVGVAYQVVELINGVRRSYLIQIPHNLGASLTLYSLVQLAAAPGLSFPGGLGNLNSITAANGTVVIGGTSTNPTVRANVGTTSGTVAAGDDSRFSLAALLTRLAAAPVTVTYAASVTPDASLGCVHRVTATGALTLAGIINGVDGQLVTIEVLASGADRTVTITGGDTVPIPSGTWWTGSFRYNAGVDTWIGGPA